VCAGVFGGHTIASATSSAAAADGADSARNGDDEVDGALADGDGTEQSAPDQSGKLPEINRTICSSFLAVASLNTCFEFNVNWEHYTFTIVAFGTYVLKH